MRAQSGPGAAPVRRPLVNRGRRARLSGKSSPRRDFIVSESELLVIKRKREQMLKFVAKGFYRELIKYGVDAGEVLTVANNLLGHVSASPEPARAMSDTEASYNLDVVDDRWQLERCIGVLGVELKPFDMSDLPLVASWLSDPEARQSFVPEYPEGHAALGRHLTAPDADYLGVYREKQLVGIVGAENIAQQDRRLEMKKLIGEREQRGRGVGTRATFGFLYYAFMIRDVHKVYVHFRDINIRNLNLNSRFGFELEGLFLEELQAPEGRVDVVRMGLLKPIWVSLFA
jgi:RimJ/RimL family protein N-acetyltransferase